ncbi:aminopeptidase P family protein [Runella slithyformis]|uniref:Xaa-Pro aminopeptidase n=1 Tax=Runella slithyformis (strain ATCC 29530 / DSM 19594 / LMG 11500 / NCIMB 11436 / LSU 4) TaxID=761193 RepID=A0A7U3ZQE4_RUNSL|nr:aminopeptidase P family protein [Runella slithyformis]AEI51450.1 Xaa-Pro aminopeptidase [Runella slithyformis DSM 19594]
MFSTNTYASRRNKLKTQVSEGLLLFLGNEESGMNYTDNTYHFRQDSTFLYYFGLDKAGLAAIIDVESGEEWIVGDEITIDDVIWAGPQPTLQEQAARVGVVKTLPKSALEAKIKGSLSAGRSVHFLPPYRPEHTLKINHWTDWALSDIPQKVSVEFVRAVINQRSYKTDEEIIELNRAVNISGQMHVNAIRATQAGKYEYEVVGTVHGTARSEGGDLAYPIILSVDGQTLHNHYHGNRLESGRLVLGDFGAETAMHYAGDITRTWPVDKTFTQQQKEIYQIVLEANINVINALRPGITYLDCHNLAWRTVVEGLKGLGLLEGDTDEMVALGVPALFMPHGLGHMIGMDVHDMENLGENYIGYRDGLERSKLLGLKSLRMAKELETGFVLTIEPGIYFIPELIQLWESQGKFQEYIQYDKLNPYRGFGGVRIEDNYLITKDGAQLIGDPIPKTIAEIEALRS